MGPDNGASDPSGPFDGMTDHQVLERAGRALRRVHAAPLTGLERSIQWAVYEQAKAELDVRLYRHVIAKLAAADAPDSGGTEA